MTRDLKHWAYRAISHFWDLKAETVISGVNGKLQVRMVNGKLFLDSSHANYSFGSLHKLFRKVFRHIGIESRPPSNLLLLGLGAGSVISIIRDEYGLGFPVTAVDKDPEVIRIANEYFGLGLYSNLDVICMDAEEYVLQSAGSFGLIVIDLFVDNDVPENFTRLSFLQALGRALTPGGRIIFNFIVGNPAQGESYKTLLLNLDSAGFSHEELRLYSTNRVLFISRT